MGQGNAYHFINGGKKINSFLRGGATFRGLKRDAT
jgi:uncharacterized cupin superfamily protein